MDRPDDVTAPSPAPTPPSRRRRVGRALGWITSIIVLVVAAFVVRDRWSDVSAAGGLPGVAPVVLAVVLNIAGNALLAFTWRDIVSLAGPRIPYRAAAWIWSLSQLARFTLAVAQVGARAVLARRWGVTAMVGGASALVEVAWAASINPLLMFATFTSWAPDARDLSWLTWVGVIPAAVLLLGVVHPAALLRLVSWALGLPVINRIAGGRLSGAVAAIEISRGESLRLTALFTLNNGIRLAAFLVIVAAVGGDLAEIGWRSVGAFALGQFVGRLAIFAPGGIGPREGATAVVLAPVLGGGGALVVVAATRLTEMVAEVIFFGAARLTRPPDPDPDPAPRPRADVT